MTRLRRYSQIEKERALNRAIGVLNRSIDGIKKEQSTG